MNETPFRAGFAVILGKPNAGKSTLLNALLKWKLSIVSPKPQTTRHNILGILNGPGFQVCFLDTPGLIDRPTDDLQRALASAARGAAHKDADVLIFLAELGIPPAEELLQLASLLRSRSPLILCVNKIDQAKPGEADAVQKAYADALKPVASFKISARGKEGVAELMAEISKHLPESPAFYETDQVSDRWERFFASEIIREKIFDQYRQEIPHACAVVIEEFKEAKGLPDRIFATLYVERDGQKGIIIGKKGQDLRELVDRSREAIENFIGRPAELDIRVKVRKDWRKDPRSIAEFGYTP